MQIDSLGLYVKLALEDLKSLLSIGEKIDVKILEKLGNNTYLIKVKNETLKAFSTVNFRKGDVATLIVEKTKPSVVLKLLNDKPKSFIPIKQQSLELKKVDIEKLIFRSEQLKPSEEDNTIKNIADKIKNAMYILHNTSKSLPQGNIFIQIPVYSNDTRQGFLYIQEDAEKKNENGKKNIRIVIYAAPEKLGSIKIDMLYSKDKINCSLFCEKDKGFEILDNNKDKIWLLLGNNANVSINILNDKPIFLKKQIDLKI